MPIQSFSYDEAAANLRDRLSRWPDGRRDQSRLSGIAQVQLKPSFRFNPGEPIFTVGSCFAPDYSWRLGLQLIRLDRLDEGERRLRECLAIDPAHKAALEALAGLADHRRTGASAGVFGGAEADNA